MKQKKRYKKVQGGIDNTPVFNLKPKQDDYSWMDVNPAFPAIPGAVDPINSMQIQPQPGSVDANGAPIVPLNPDGGYTFRRRVGTGVYRNNPYVDAFNYGAMGATAIGNIIQNNKLKNEEQRQVMRSLEPRYWENMQGEGLNNIPMYTKAGGGPSAAKAREMLRDGTVNGQPLTEKQKRYFGWIAGGKKQAGGVIPNAGELLPQDMDPSMLEAFENAKRVRVRNNGKFKALIPGEDWTDDILNYADKVKFVNRGGEVFIKVKGKLKKLPGKLPEAVEGPEENLQTLQFGGRMPISNPMNPANPISPANPNSLMKQVKKEKERKALEKKNKEDADKFTKYVLLGKRDKDSEQYMRDYDSRFVRRQTGGSNIRNLSPDEMNQWNQFLDFVKLKGLEGSPALNERNKNLGETLFNEFKGANPNVSINYDIVPAVQNQMQILKQTTQDFARRKNLANADQLLEGISPVDGWFGSKTSQFRFPDATLVTKNNGQIVGQSNLGLVNSNLQATGKGARMVPAGPPKGVPIEDLFDEAGNKVGRGYTDPVSGDTVQLRAGGRRKKKKYIYQDGGFVEAEQGEIIEDQSGQIVKVSDNEKRHESGGVKLKNVNRVLQDTSDKRKDKASKMLAVSPEEMEGLFGFKPKGSVSHSKAFELAKEHYDKKRDKINLNNKRLNSRPEIDKYSAKTAELNFNTKQNIPTDEDIMDALFMHQETVKAINGIEDDGSMAKYGWKYPKAQGGFSRPPRTSKSGEWVFNEADQRWYKAGTVPVNPVQTAAAPATGTPSGIQPYAGGRTVSGRTTPEGNPNAFNFLGGLPAYKTAWSPILDLNQYSTVKDAQQATYNYLVQNQPDVAASIWQSQGLTAKGRTMMDPKSKDYDPTFATVANAVFDSSGKIKQGVKLTPEQLQALTPAYADDLLGVRAVTPQQFTTTEQAVPTAATPPRQPLDTSVNINPNFRTQPSNRFREPLYADELAPGLFSYIDSLARYPELYNPVQFNQLKYKRLDPTAALTANQADYNAALEAVSQMSPGSGAAAATVAGLQAQKYAANNQVQGQYDNQNVAIENREIDYNTNVRDRQSVADAQTRGQYFKDVQLSREAQRQQRLKSIEDISRVIQLKRRQNRSGNLIMKLSPAFDQFGEYNSYQYAPVLPPELGLPSDLSVLTTGKPKTKTTTSWKMGDRTIKREVRG